MIDEYAKSGRKFLLLVAVLCLAAALALALGIFRFSLREAPGLPFLDQWEMMRELATGHGHYSFAQLWQQHNEHRIVFSKLLLLADFHLFKATGIVPIICIFITQALHCLLFCAAAWSLRHFSVPLRVGVCALMLVFFFTPAHFEDFLWPHEFSFVFAMFAGSLSLFLLAIDHENGRPRRYWMFAGCILAAVCSTVSLATGVFLWPVLILFCVVLRVPRKLLVLMIVSAAVTLGAYFYDYHRSAAPFISIRHPGMLAEYLFAYLGGSWEIYGLAAAIAIGTAGLLAALFLLFTRFLRVSSLKSADVFSLSVIVWTLIIATMTAAGRLYSGLDQALTSRYQAIALVFWAALALRSISAAVIRKRGLAFTSVVVMAFAIVAAGPLLKLGSFIARYEGRTLLWRGAEASALSDVNDRQFLRAMYPVSVGMEPALEYLRQKRLAIFSNNLYPQLGLSFASVYKVDARVRCAGFVSRAQLLRNVTRSGFRLSGWAWNVAASAPFNRFVVVDNRGFISGFGVGGYGYDGAPAPGIPRKDNGWVGFSRLELGAHQVQVYGVLNDGESVCPVGEPADVSAQESTYLLDVNSIVVQLARGRRGVFRAGHWWPNTEGLQADHKCEGVFGQAGDTPVIGDWDGTGKLRIGVFRAGQWWVDINGNGKWDSSIDRVFAFGGAGDKPISGDWDGTGKLRIGVFRAGQWWVDINGDDKWEQKVDRLFDFGQPGDVPVVGDWDGTGKLRIGVFRGGEWWLDIDGDNKWTEEKDVKIQFGRPGDAPVIGNWDHVGKLRIGVYRHGHWLLDMNGDNAWVNQDDENIVFGESGDSTSLFGWPVSTWQRTK